MGFLGGTSGKEPACQSRRHKEMWVWSLGREDTLEEGVATYYSILLWRIPWTEEPGGLRCMGLQSQTQFKWLSISDTQYLSFSDLTSLSTMPSKSIHIIGNSKNSILFYGWVVFHCIYTPYLLYPFICWWTLRLLPYLGIVNNTAVNTGVCISFQIKVFYFVF